MFPRTIVATCVPALRTNLIKRHLQTVARPTPLNHRSGDRQVRSSSSSSSSSMATTTSENTNGKKGNSDIHLYTAATPNGIKISILLEELGLPYKVTNISFNKNEQKEPWFLEINPNGRIPALTDVFTDGTQIRLFESGSIMQYLVDQYDTDHKVSYPRGTKEYYEVNHWLFWQMGGLGPMQGQAHHFYRYAPEKIPYAIKRYQNETRRLYGVMESQLAKSKSGYLVGDKLTIADIACWGWVAAYHWAGVDIDEFPHLNAWLEKLLQHPGVEKGRHVPERHTSLDWRNVSQEELEKRAASSWVRAQSTKDVDDAK